MCIDAYITRYQHTQVEVLPTLGSGNAEKLAALSLLAQVVAGEHGALGPISPHGYIDRNPSSTKLRFSMPRFLRASKQSRALLIVCLKPQLGEFMASIRDRISAEHISGDCPTVGGRGKAPRDSRASAGFPCRIPE